MKKLFILPFLIISCTTIKQLNNQQITTIVDCKPVQMNSKMIHYDVKVDGSNHFFLFDTGATMSVVTDSTILVDRKNKKFGNLGTVTGADGKEVQLKTFTAKTESQLFESENKVFAYLPKSLSKCEKKENFSGILGLDVFFKDNNALQLDFSNNKICNISLNQINEIKNDYFEIKSECKSKQVFIFLIIEGNEYKFKLDTGFSGSLAIPFNEKLNFSKYRSLVYVGKMYRTATGFTNSEESFYEKIPVEIGSIKIDSKILVSKSLKSQNIGNDFIKAFDWIIDYNNNKVYMKKNSNNVDSEFNKNSFQYLVSEKNDILSIRAKQKNLNHFNLDDQIISVNSQKVTPENICKIQELLNKTVDWSTLDVEVISAK